jgi:hypothetical protein
MERVKLANNRGISGLVPSLLSVSSWAYGTLKEIGFPSDEAVENVTVLDAHVYADTPSVYSGKETFGSLRAIEPLDKRATNVTWLAATDTELKDLQSVRSTYASSAKYCTT